ncbi:protein kinase domain-containing protein [Scytonema sp. NUACC26]|uniref:protein kinase domain-containing protein n=1 Tax=Scytonema sp. NUACC26 TaxID=3140176 RepID=UPI0034DBC683
MNAPKPGDLLDNRYRLIRTLATGGFGQTYLAEDTRRPGNPMCVVKHLTPTSNNPRYLENATRLFLTEAQTLERLGIIHDQIPRLLAYFEENQEFYLVQDWIDGHTLSDELQSGQRWSETKVCQMFHEVLKILQFIHGFGVIHRDIKPDNLIRRRQDDRLVLVDFGTVKQIRSQILTPGQINANATIAVGTPGYMPTEQSRGNPRPNSDIYALGIIGIQALTGLNPIQFQEDDETGEIIWQPWAQVSDEFASIVNTMVRYHFKDRYQSATDALQVLEPVLAGVIPTSPQLGVTSFEQTPTVPQLKQVSSQPSGNSITIPQSKQVSSQSSGSPIVDSQLAPDSGKSAVQHSEKNNSVSPLSKLLVPKKDSQFYARSLQQAVILGSGSWLLAIFVVSIVGTVWLSAIFWLIILGIFIFKFFGKHYPSFEKYSVFGITVISSAITFLIVPQSFLLKGLLRAGLPGLLITLLLAIFAGAFAFIIIILYQLFEENKK